MIVAIHQPESFPWLGFFHKMYCADVFVILDTVQFEKNNVQNRNKILIDRKPSWLTLPVKKMPLNTKIINIEMVLNQSLSDKHLRIIKQNYKSCPNFEILFPLIEKLYKKKYTHLAEFNFEFIMIMKDLLGISTKIVRASELGLSGTLTGGTEVTLEICKKLGATTYLSGSGAKVYLNTERYKEEGIKVLFQSFKHPTYFQKNVDEFIPYLSILDLYFNHGSKSLDIILSVNKNQ